MILLFLLSFMLQCNITKTAAQQVTVETSASKQKSIFDQILSLQSLQNIVFDYLDDYEKTQEITLAENKRIDMTCASPNGNYIAMVSSGNIIIWKLIAHNNYQQQQIIPIISPEFMGLRQIHGIALSPDGSYLAITATGCPEIIDHFAPPGYYPQTYTHLHIFQLQDNIYKEIQNIPLAHATLLAFWTKNKDTYLAINHSHGINILKFLQNKCEKAYQIDSNATDHGFAHTLRVFDGNLIIRGIRDYNKQIIEIWKFDNDKYIPLEKHSGISANNNYIVANLKTNDKHCLVVSQIQNNDIKQIIETALPFAASVRNIILPHDKYVIITLAKQSHNETEYEVLFYEIDGKINKLKQIASIKNINLIDFLDNKKLIAGVPENDSDTDYSKLIIYQNIAAQIKAYHTNHS
jgi:hypothetical protein